MIKTAKQLNKSEKLLLLEAIKTGSVDKKPLTPGTLFATEYKDFFLGLMIASNQVSGKRVQVVCLGDANKAREELFPQNNGPR